MLKAHCHIGASGVGKTSLRGQYISGRFTNGYRTTIGADFITKTLPHPSNPADIVALQIWDTAGQQRFSSLSSAFFRGADAALLMFDINTPETMTALTKCWAEFRERAPLADEDVEGYCCVVVGNKTDLVGSGGRNGEGPVTEAEAHDFLSKLIPLNSRSPSPIYASWLQDELSPEVEIDARDDPLASSQVTIRPSSPPSPPRTRSDSTAILPNGHHAASSSSPLLSYSPETPPLQVPLPLLIALFLRHNDHDTHHAHNLPHPILVPLRHLPVRAQLARAPVVRLLIRLFKRTPTPPRLHEQTTLDRQRKFRKRRHRQARPLRPRTRLIFRLPRLPDRRGPPPRTRPLRPHPLPGPAPACTRAQAVLHVCEEGRRCGGCV
ncbi:putative ras of Complex, Roc, domain of DAPkinase [Lyophyllum shimeji]|uniref:Ras of Complex, Roc, domain of DAPkinase n=1 Tax=Lyophyllum shimeji TaxID=47721 RepID=A0A9P3UQU9_LYOSH|nr:putative ras of Complex, Roc, domain of DAPkinase [Lyophyllum shimeji]